MASICASLSLPRQPATKPLPTNRPFCETCCGFCFSFWRILSRELFAMARWIVSGLISTPRKAHISERGAVVSRRMSSKRTTRRLPLGPREESSQDDTWLCQEPYPSTSPRAKDCKYSSKLPLNQPSEVWYSYSELTTSRASRTMYIALL